MGESRKGEAEKVRWRRENAFFGGECEGIMKAFFLTELFLEGSCLCLGFAFPSLWPVFFIIAGVSVTGLTALGFFVTDRKVAYTMEQVDDTICGLMEQRRTDYFAPNEDSLLGKFQSQIYRLHEILRSYEEQEKRLRVSLSGAVSDLVHQINTPITNLMVYSGFLEQEELGREDRLRFAGRIRQQAQKLSFLGEGFARLSRLETGVIDLHPVRQEVLPSLLSAMQQIEPRAQANGNALEFEGEEKLCAVLDAKWTEEVFFNILDNAVKYGKPGGRITARVEAGELYVRVDLRNEGEPIPTEEYPLLFRRFGRGKGTEVKEGVGLGLYLAREILKRQDGHIRISYDSERKENVFSVFLRLGSGQ